jgi:hypothetical protein
MGEQFFDDLAKGLNDGTVSRGRALKLVGAAILSSSLMPLFPRQAHASRATRRCLRKGGALLSTGTCHCAHTCTTTATYGTLHCHGTKNCLCLQTVEGEGFCTTTGASSNGCSSSTDCSGSNKCAVFTQPAVCNRGTCTTKTDCQALGPGFACINGVCRSTACASPCHK